MSAEDRRQRTRDEFVDAAIRVIDAEGPQASMDDIAREAGSTKPRLYRYFDDKGDLFQAVARRIGSDLYRVVRPDLDFVLHSTADALNRALTAYADVIAQHPNVFRFLSQAPLARDDNASPLPMDIGRDVSKRLSPIATGALEAIHAETAGVELATRAAVAAVVAATDSWLYSSDESTPLTQGEFVEQTRVIVWGIVDAFLRSKRVEIDPAEPMFMILARRAGQQ